MGRLFFILLFLAVSGVAFGQVEDSKNGVEILILAETGQVMSVRPSGWIWGKKEIAPKFIIVKVDDSTYEDLKYLEIVKNKEEVGVLISKEQDVPVKIISQKIDTAKSISSSVVIMTTKDVTDSFKESK